MKKNFLFTTDSNISNFCLFFTVLFFINCSNQKKSISSYNSSNTNVTTKKNDFPDEFESSNKNDKSQELNNPDLTTKKNKKNDELGSEEWAEKERRKIEEDYEKNVEEIKKRFKIERENEEKRSALVLDELEKKYQVEKSEIELAIKKSEDDYNSRIKKMNDMNAEASKKWEKKYEEYKEELDLQNIDIDTNISFKNPKSDKKKTSTNKNFLKKEDNISLQNISLQEKIEFLFSLLVFKDKNSKDFKLVIESLKNENSQKTINISIFWDKVKELQKDWSFDLIRLSQIMDIFCFSMDQIYGDFGKSEFLKILKKEIDEMVIELNDALFQIVKFVSIEKNLKSEINQIYFEKIKNIILKDKKATIVKILKDEYPNLNFEEFIQFIKNKNLEDSIEDSIGKELKELSKVKEMLIAKISLESYFKMRGIELDEMLAF